VRGDQWSPEELAAMQKRARQQLSGAPLSAFAGGFTDEQLKLDPVLRYFHYAHLPPQLQPISRLFCTQARWIVDYVPRNAERTVALRKLLEAKDAAVRANVPAPGEDVTGKWPAKPETFLDRLHQEYGELNERKAKLWAFITSLGGFSDLPADEQVRLRQQHTVMDQYAQILIERISSAEDIRKQRSADIGYPSFSRIPPDIQSEQNSGALKLRATELERKHCTCGESKAACPVHEPDMQPGDGDNVSWPGEGEQIDENVRVTGGGKSEDPLPFNE
jgi:hypothetical protein